MKGLCSCYLMFVSLAYIYIKYIFYAKLRDIIYIVTKVNNILRVYICLLLNELAGGGVNVLGWQLNSLPKRGRAGEGADKGFPTPRIIQGGKCFGLAA